MTYFTTVMNERRLTIRMARRPGWRMLYYYYHYYHEHMERYIELDSSVDRGDIALDGKDLVKAFQLGGLLLLHFHFFVSFQHSSYHSLFSGTSRLNGSRNMYSHHRFSYIVLAYISSQFCTIGGRTSQDFSLTYLSAKMGGALEVACLELHFISGVVNRVLLANYIIRCALSPSHFNKYSADY